MPSEKNISLRGYKIVPAAVDTLDDSVLCRRGTDFILDHLEEPLFPRDIMTKRLGYKVEIFDRGSILQHFAAANFEDCRISAYPRLTQYNGINLVPPSLIMIDLDLGNLKFNFSLDAVLKITLKRIYKMIKVKPTVLWTGNGYHVYLPISAFVLEEEGIFAEFYCEQGPDLSTKFMRFAEKFFSNKRHDPQHRPSINSCLLRVPNTYNSKNGQQVRIIQEWDGRKADIRYMLRDFRRYLIQEQLDEVNAQKKAFSSNISSSPGTIRWIEQLLQTPIPDHRKYCLWRILAPYLVNVRGLSDEESISVIRLWLEKCNAMRRLTGQPRYCVRYNLRSARTKGYYPISLNKLQSENAELWSALH